MTEISNERLDELSRYIATCSQLGDSGDGQRYGWWDRLSVLLTELKSRRASHSGVEVKGFSWEANGATSLWTGELAFGVYYTAYDEGDGWRTFRQQFLSEASPAEIAFGPKYRVLADAESDYRTRILSCLTPPHSITPEGGEPVASVSEVWGWAKPDHPDAVEPRTMKGDRPEWAKSVFTIPLFTSPSPNGVTVSEEMVERLTYELVKRQVFAPGASDIQIAKMRPLYIQDARAALLAALEGGSQT